MTTEQQTILRLMTSLENAIGWLKSFRDFHGHQPNGSLCRDIEAAKRAVEDARKELER